MQRHNALCCARIINSTLNQLELEFGISRFDCKPWKFVKEVMIYVQRLNELGCEKMRQCLRDKTKIGYAKLCFY